MGCHHGGAELLTASFMLELFWRTPAINYLAETRPHNINGPVWRAKQSFVDKSICPQIVFVRFTLLHRDQCSHKTSCVRIRSNALTCIPLTPIMQRLFWRILSSKCCQKIDL